MDAGKLISFDEHKFMIKTISILSEGISRDKDFLNHKPEQHYEYVKMSIKFYLK